MAIVSLMIDGKERLCLAQISNTLLKNFSYNEIHNRRVALGITCVQVSQLFFYTNCRQLTTKLKVNKPVGDWISAPSPNFVAMATRVSPQHFAWFHLIGHPRKAPGRPKHLRSICHTSQVIGDFVQILGSKFWALGA